MCLGAKDSTNDYLGSQIKLSISFYVVMNSKFLNSEVHHIIFSAVEGNGLKASAAAGWRMMLMSERLKLCPFVL